MQVVVDTSVLMAAAIRDSRVREVLLRPGIDWAVPLEARSECWEHVGEIADAMGGSVEDAQRVLRIVFDRVTLVEVPPHCPERVTALEVIGARDASDAAFVALALRIGSPGIWSLDQDFDEIPGIVRLDTAAARRLAEAAPLR